LLIFEKKCLDDDHHLHYGEAMYFYIHSFFKQRKCFSNYIYAQTCHPNLVIPSIFLVEMNFFWTIYDYFLSTKEVVVVENYFEMMQFGPTVPKKNNEVDGW